jgi:hypothetical protein
VAPDQSHLTPKSSLPDLVPALAEHNMDGWHDGFKTYPTPYNSAFFKRAGSRGSLSPIFQTETMAIAISPIYPGCKLGGLRSNGSERKTDIRVDTIVYRYSFVIPFFYSAISYRPDDRRVDDPCQKIRPMERTV